MAGLTPNFNLRTLTGGDDFSLDGHKFTDADRVLIDRVLHAALTHTHTGVATEDDSETVDSPPILTLDPSNGSLPAGVRFFYKIALIGEDGLPSLASPETTIDSPLPVLAPDAPTASRSATLGSLLPGTYYYRLSTYRSASTLETAAGDAVAVALPLASGTTQRVILTLPSMPPGGEGYNIYRRIPGGSAFLHIATIPIADIGDDWIDDGAVAVNCERFSPSLNTTSSSNSIEIAYPGGVIPVGYTWRIYRTDVAGAWAHSWLIDVVEETSEGSGIVTPTYLDLGLGTRAGTPPTTSPPTIPTPPQIDYEDLLDAPPDLSPRVDALETLPPRVDALEAASPVDLEPRVDALETLPPRVDALEAASPVDLSPRVDALETLPPRVDALEAASPVDLEPRVDALETLPPRVDALEAASPVDLSPRVDALETSRVSSTSITSIERLTQAAYDALGTPDVGTLYVIVAA